MEDFLTSCASAIRPRSARLRCYSDERHPVEFLQGWAGERRPVCLVQNEPVELGVDWCEGQNEEVGLTHATRCQ